MIEVTLYFQDRSKRSDLFVCDKCEISNGVVFLKNVIQINRENVNKHNISYNMNVAGITMVNEFSY